MPWVQLFICSGCGATARGAELDNYGGGTRSHSLAGTTSVSIYDDAWKLPPGWVYPDKLPSGIPTYGRQFPTFCSLKCRLMFGGEIS